MKAHLYDRTFGLRRRREAADENPAGNENYYIVTNTSGFQGVYSLKDNKEIVPCKYSYIETHYYDFYPNDDYNPDLLCAFIAYTSDDISTSKDYYTPNGQFITSTDNDIEWDIMRGTDILKGLLYNHDDYGVKNGYFIFERLTGKIIQNRKCEIFDNGDEDQLIIKTGEKFGVINATTGNYIIKPEYDSISGYIPYLAFKNGKVELINTEGVVEIPAGMYDNISEYSCCLSTKERSCAYSVSKNKKWGCVDDKNNVVLPLIYDSEVIYSDTMWVLRNNKWGTINNTGKEIIAFQYDTIIFDNYDNFDIWDDIYFDYYTVKKDNKWGCIKTTGENILPIEYDSPIVYYDTMWVSKNGMWTCIDRDMKQVIEAKFDATLFSNFQFTENNTITCQFHNARIEMDLQGNIRDHYKNMAEAAYYNDTTGTLFYSLTATPREKAHALHYAISVNQNLKMFYLILKTKPDLTCNYDEHPIALCDVFENMAYDSTQYNIPLWKARLMTEALLKEGAYLNNTCNFNRSPLMYLATCFPDPKYNILEGYDESLKDCMSFLKMLLEAGCDVNAEDQSGKDVLYYFKIKDKEAQTFIKEYIKSKK